MRVLLTTDTIGGVWTFTRELTIELLALDHSVALISFGHLPSAEQREWIERIRLDAHGFFRYAASDAPLEWMQQNATAYAAALPALMQLVEEFDPDIVHTSQFCFGCLPREVPTLVTAHSDVLSWAEACQPEGLAPSPWLAQYRRLVQRGLESASAVVAPTEWMLTTLRRHFSFTAPASVIYNGRGLPASKLQPRPFQAVSAGRLWDKAKNLAMLAQIDLPVVIAGESSNEGARAPRLPENMRMAGPLREAALLELFASSSVYIAPALYEPFGLAPLEAALCGCAIVANDLPSLKEVWVDAAVYVRNAEELSQTLKYLQADEDALLQARTKAQLRARQFTAVRMSCEYIALYRDVLGSSAIAPKELAHV